MSTMSDILSRQQDENQPLKMAAILKALQDDGLLTASYGSGSCEKVSFPVTDTREIGSKPRAENGKTSFICIKGYVTDGHIHAQEAVDKGVSVIFSEYKLDLNEKERDREAAGTLHNNPAVDITNIVVSDSRKALAVLAKLYYNNPSSRFTLIGITGTNGKTSIVKIIEQILLRNGVKTATIGTLGYSIGGEDHPLERTTPDIVDLNRLLSLFAAEGIKYVVMEVSSHALALHRVYGLSFDFALFSNLSREHLDFHKDMESYFRSKAILFRYLEQTKGTALINYDDSYGKRLADSFKGRQVLIKTKHQAEKQVTAVAGKVKLKAEQGTYLSEYNILSQSMQETIVELSIRSGESVYSSSLHSGLSGEYNAFNICAALTTAFLALNPKRGERTTTLAALSGSLPTSIKGRLERVKNDRSINCFIDYAHTPEALEQVCGTLKSLGTENYGESRLICVFGAGGDRDKGKRTEMTKAVLKHSDIAIITSDNPRTEDIRAIIFDLINGLHPLDNFLIYCSRKTAIGAAIRMATEKDIVLIAGKGHEKYQTVGNRKYEFDDYQEAVTAINGKDVDGTVYDLQANESCSTSRLSIPLDPLQVKLILGWCDEKDLAAGRCSNPERYSDTYISRSESLKSKILSSKWPETDRITDSISTDTRTIGSNSCFIALQGENYDGHDYLETALSDSTNYAVVNQICPRGKIDASRLISVADTRTALALLAKKYKSLFPAYTVALTGSTGKTSVKEYCYQIFSQAGKTLKNISNENNIIGLSRTIFALNSSYRYLVLELGTNQVGEMQVLADTAQPDLAMITNIGPCHLQAFRDIQGVYREKITLLERKAKARIIPAEETVFSQFGLPSVKLRKTPSLPGKETAATTFVIINSSGRKFFFELDGDYKIAKQADNIYELPNDIAFLADNAAFAVSAALVAGIVSRSISEGLAKPLKLKLRMETVSIGGKHLLMDCYNANPTSMKAALDYWLSFEPQKKHIAILGDMLELGEHSEELHRDIGRYLSGINTENTRTDHLILTVGDYAYLYDGDCHFESVESLSEWLEKQEIFDIKQVVFLVKGSRGLHLEKLADKLKTNHHRD